MSGGWAERKIHYTGNFTTQYYDTINHRISDADVLEMCSVKVGIHGMVDFGVSKYIFIFIFPYNSLFPMIGITCTSLSVHIVCIALRAIHQHRRYVHIVGVHVDDHHWHNAPERPERVETFGIRIAARRIRTFVNVATCFPVVSIQQPAAGANAKYTS